ncbi:RNase P subunit p30 [Hypoxylon argillaceum]|nr:RNase P subunit p30 [Hypoxylon argillaceum]KAI1153697.1 RNase P subunit p30 [Nemania diffusa]
MLYDLNIAWSPSTSAADLERTLRFSASLGYDVVALNHTIGAPVPPQITNPLPKFDPSSPSSSNPPPRLPTVLRRATLVLSEASQHHRLPQLASAYDILAVRPQSEESFSAACLSLNDVSLISLDLTVRQPFTFRPKPCMFAVSRGVRFEVCYSQVLQGPAPAHVVGSKGARNGGESPAGNGGAGGVVDARARAAFIGNVSSLIRATRGRGIVISSEARSVLGLRAPADVVNLLHVWGLSTDRANEGLGALPRGVVVNEGLKRSGFRGVVDIVGVADREQVDVEMGEAGDSNAKAASGNIQGKKGKNNKKQESNGSGGKKRKNDDDTETHTPTSVNETEKPEGEGEDQPISKRQAKKKMKAALRKKQTEESATGT